VAVGVEPRPGPGTPPPVSDNAQFASGARVLSIGIASTGIFTFAYLATASQVLNPAAYSRISLCWAIMFVILSVIYRPIEQLLSRTIADRRARGLKGQSLRVPASIQLGFALAFLAAALTLRHRIEHGIFDGSAALYWILVIGVLAYAASYFARGWLAGHQRFALYGGLVFLESTSRFLFALAVALGIGSGQGVVGLGMAVAPFASLCVIPFAFSRTRAPARRGPAAVLAGGPDAVLAGGPAAVLAGGPAAVLAGGPAAVLAGGPAAVLAGGPAAVLAGGPAGVPAADAASEGPAHAGLEEASSDLSLRHGAGFAVAVVGIMLAEQTLMNAGVLIVAAKSTGATLVGGLTGFVFNVMLIVRAPLQLFQAIQTSILPHLAGLEARESADEFHRAIRVTILVIAGFGAAVALGLLAIGPPVMTALLGDKGFHYARLGLAVVGLGMGLHLISGTLNQAALARGRALVASAAWLTSAALFVVFVATASYQGGAHAGAEVTRVEVGYFIATAVLCLLLWGIYRAPRRGPARIAPASAV
jgi:O-antigen/teichoic acid export membrane protein